MARRRWDGEDGDDAVMWRGRDESLGAKDATNRQTINHSIMETLHAVYALAIIRE